MKHCWTNMFLRLWYFGSTGRIFSVFLILICCLILLIQAQANSALGQKTIDNELKFTNRIVKSGSKFNLYCTAACKPDSKTTNDIIWQFSRKNGPFWAYFKPSKEVDSEFLSNPSSKSSSLKSLQEITPIENRYVVSQTRFKNGTLLGTLEVRDTSYFDTGLFTCITRDNNGNIVEVKAQHIFVEDSNSSFVPPTSSEKDKPEVIGIFSQPNLTVGCLPTHPSIQIELYNITDCVLLLGDKKLIAKSNDNGKTGNNSYSVNSSWSFDPLKGFIFRNIVTWEIVGNYECRSKNSHGADLDSSVFEIEVHGVEVISSSSKQLIEAGSPFELTCRGRKPQLENQISSSPMRLSWAWISSYPINSQKKNLTRSIRPPGIPEMIDSTDDSVGLIYSQYTIKWKSIPGEASGTYLCSDSNDSTFPPGSTRLNVFLKPIKQEYRAISNGYRSISKFFEGRDYKRHIYKAGDNFRIECRGPRTPVYRRWVKPNRANDNEFYRKVQAKHLSMRWSSESNNQSTLQAFWINTTVMNASYLDTGYYICVGTYKFEELFDLRFIFIQDSEHLILPPALRSDGPNDELRIIGHYGEQYVPIGCGPTHPDVQVFLKHKHDDNKFKTIASSLTPNDTQSNWAFSIYEGFLIKTVDLWEMEGQYFCEATWPNQTSVKSVSDYFHIRIQGIEITPLPDIPITEGNDVTLTCRSKNNEDVKISWRWIPFNLTYGKNGVVIEINSTKLSSEGGLNYLNPFEEETADEEYPMSFGKFKVSRLRLKEISVQALGIYQCYDANDLDIPAKNISVSISRKPKSNSVAKPLVHGVIAIIVVAIVIIVTVIIITIRWMFIKSIRKQKRMYLELVNTRLKLLEGNLERINPDISIEDQMDFLPYDPKYEFPVNHLVFGDLLGVGQYGRVFKAKAVGMGSSGNKTVAVKTVKSQTDNMGLSSLASELKILIHLGRHLNVVNLLGACTKNLSKGELLVIVEFCRYGNLKSFLFSNRCNFINESIDDLDLLINCRIRINENKLTSSSTNLNESNDQGVQEKEKFFNLIPNKKKEIIFRKSTVCVHDLINWSFQIASGMNYLTKKKVLHGDLAARNVLLADNDVVKIADFGLSRKLYQNRDYEKQGEEALPVRWMAIESLIDHAFSSKSDVWAFGVTIWEIFTLCQQPYPGVSGLADLISFLKNGHRMEKPEYAPDVIGKIMADCWKHNPLDRKTFDELERTLGQLVDENTRKRYTSNDTAEADYNLSSNCERIVLNDYLKMSSQEVKELKKQEQPTDYENVLVNVKEPCKPLLQLKNYDRSSYVNMGHT